MMFICRSRRWRSPPTHALAGVDDILSKCYDFGRRMFALHEAGAVAGRMLAVFSRSVRHLTDLTSKFRVFS
jgi:hypothetical protein